MEIRERFIADIKEKYPEVMIEVIGHSSPFGMPYVHFYLYDLHWGINLYDWNIGFVEISAKLFLLKNENNLEKQITTQIEGEEDLEAFISWTNNKFIYIKEQNKLKKENPNLEKFGFFE